MKRTYDEPHITSSYGVGVGGGEAYNGVWPPEPPQQHPYATGYGFAGMDDANSYEATMYQDIGIGSSGQGKRTKLEESDGDDDDDEDGDDDDDALRGKKSGKDGKPKQKLTRGSRACIACRKIKMRCIQDDSLPNGPCKRCRTGGHECIFEESNRGKRATRKHEALAAKVDKMESALQGIGAALGSLDQHSLNAFSAALHGFVNDPEVLGTITAHTKPSAGPSGAMAVSRPPYPIVPSSEHGFGMSQMRGEDSAPDAHLGRPPISPRLHSLPDNILSPLGLLAEASLQNTDGKKRVPTGDGMVHRSSPLNPNAGGNSTGGSASFRMATSDVRGGMTTEDEEKAFAELGKGVASSNYFRPGTIAPFPGGADDRLPELLTIVSREDIAELFDIFYAHISPHVPLLYREFHTPDLVLQRSQFLCTVICAIAARYYHQKPDLHAKLSIYAKRLAFEVPSRGYKSVEVCQAYLLLSVWTLGPEKTFEQDRTWLMLGMAIRMATDLNLHRKSSISGLDNEESRARDLEIINRERCWLHCFVLDRSLSAQMGKPYTLREDYIIRNACEASWHQQKYCLPSDKALSAYVVLQQIMSRAIDSIYSSTTTVSGLRQDCDYMMIVRSAHEELRRWLTEWDRLDNYTPVELAAGYNSRAQFYFAYHSLVLYSFGLENAIERAKMDISFFLTNVFEAATRVCAVVKEEFVPKGYLPYLPDTNFVMCSYALLSLLKLLKPELRSYHASEDAILKLVSEMADVLEQAAVDTSHQPAIYAAFIREIVRKTKEGRRLDGQSSRVGSPGMHDSAMANGAGDPELGDGMYDPQLMDPNWQSGEMNGDHAAQFAFVPQGGDMMILPSAAGPSQSLQNSPSTSFIPGFTPTTMQNLGLATLPPGSTPLNHPSTGGMNGEGQPVTAASQGWAEYLPTFMSSDGFDGWNGSMLLPGFGRDQITLGGGLLHSQFGSGIITPANHTPTGSRSQSRAHSPA